MKRRLITSLLTLIIALVAVPVSAQELEPAPVGSCPPAFELHHHHDGEAMPEEHKHVGVPMEQVDRNNDGYICVKHVGKDGNNHVHVDNNRPVDAPNAGKQHHVGS